MIKISDNFKTDDKKLAALYKGARDTLCSSLKPFGDFELMCRSSAAPKVSLASEVMSAETYARYDVATAMNTIKAFAMTQREDGQLACEIVKSGEDILCDYSGLSAFSFIDEAMSLYFMTKRKEHAYLDMIYNMLTRFDEYLKNTHDYNKNGLPELLSEKETAERHPSRRYAPLTINEGGEIRDISLFPVESYLLAAFTYKLKIALGWISSMIGDDRDGIYFDEAEIIKARLKNFFWVEEQSACFDRDYRGSLMKPLAIDNLFMMYYDALDIPTANAFLNAHLFNPDEFYTPFPLPTYPVNSPDFSNDPAVSFGGQPRGETFRRAIRAFEKYGYYRELTHVGKRFLEAVGNSLAFTEQYDPFTGAPSRSNICADYAPTASAVLEIIARFYGITVLYDQMHWGAMGHEGEETSEYNFKWGGDLFTLAAEKETSMGLINGSPIFTITNGVRVITDWYGDKPRVVNITDETMDCVFVYRNQTFSFSIAPGETKEFS